MPIQFPDFGRISFDAANPVLTGIGKGQDIFSKILAQQIARVQAQYAEPMAKEGLLKEQQYNKMYIPNIQSEIGLRGAQAGKLGKETQWYDREASSRINAQGAQAAHATAEADKIKYMLQHPGFMGGDETKQIEALKQMGLLNEKYQSTNQGNPAASEGVNTETNPISQAIGNEKQSYRTPGFDIDSMVKALIEAPMTNLQYKRTLNQVMQQNLQGKAYNSMPSAEKAYAIAQARGFGYTGEQASKMFNQGWDLSSMAKEKGYDPEDTSKWPAAKGAPTAAIQTRIQRANSTLAALNAVEEDISQAYSEYAPRFRNVSPFLIKDMISGENPDKQADILAAYALYPEISALRINAMGGNVGEGAIQHIADAAFSRLNTLGISPNSFVYQKIQKRIGQLINRMNKAENSSIYGQRNQSYADDDSRQSYNDITKMSDEELAKIAGIS